MHDIMESEESRFAKSDMESFEMFKDIVPKNKYGWEGGIVLYDAASEEFFNIAFGAGGNLDADDIDAGFDDTGVAKFALLEPAADIGSLEQVFVVTDYNAG